MWHMCGCKDEVRSMKVRRVKSEENVADLGTKPLSKAVIANHCLTLGFVNTAEENVWCKVQDVAMLGSFGPIQMIVTGVRTVRAQNTAGDHAKKSVHREPAAATAATDAAAASGRRAGDRRDGRVAKRVGNTGYRPSKTEHTSKCLQTSSRMISTRSSTSSTGSS